MPATGVLLEIGLGNGRTYSDLSEVFPDRRIIGFDRAQAAHASSTPAPEDLVLDEIFQTAQAFVGQILALVHPDIGNGCPDCDARTLGWMPAFAAWLLGRGGTAASRLPLVHPDLPTLHDKVNVDRSLLSGLRA